MNPQRPTRSRRIRTAVLLLSVAAGSASTSRIARSSGPTTGEIDAASARTFYRSFSRLTEWPHEVSMHLALLCTRPGPAQLQAERDRVGPHAQARVYFYASDVAVPALARAERRFEPGAIVVKEKLADDLSVEAVGGMVKRPPGYDPEGGDWWYFYSEKDGAFTSGKIETCRGCHAGAKASDHVFFVRPEPGAAGQEGSK